MINAPAPCFSAPQNALQVLGEAVAVLEPGQALATLAAHTAANDHPALARRMGLERGNESSDGDNCGGDVGQGANSDWRLRCQPRWRLQWLQQEHIPAWHALFQACFGYAMPEALRQWKYRDAACMGIGVWRAGAMVAFYGGMPRGICYFGTPAMAAQIGDVMVHPSQRGAFTRQGPFQIAAATYLEQCLGYGQRYLLGFGFPEEKALKLAQHLGLYAPVDAMVELRWPGLAEPEPRHWSRYTQALQPADAARHSALLDALWQRMQASFGKGSIVGVRNWAFVHGRYLLHPSMPYTLLLVRRRLGGRLLGLAVLRDRQEQGIELLDLVAPVAFFGPMVQVCRHFAGSLGRSSLFAWVSESHACLLADAHSQKSPLNLAVPANIWSPGPTLETLQNRWWLMGGDTDFR